MPFHNGAETAPLRLSYGTQPALHGTWTALDGAWYDCWGPLLVPVRWCDGVGAAAKW